jgi:hypothetical protein
MCAQRFSPRVLALQKGSALNLEWGVVGLVLILLHWTKLHVGMIDCSLDNVSFVISSKYNEFEGRQFVSASDFDAPRESNPPAEGETLESPESEDSCPIVDEMLSFKKVRVGLVLKEPVLVLHVGAGDYSAAPTKVHLRQGSNKIFTNCSQ